MSQSWGGGLGDSGGQFKRAINKNLYSQEILGQEGMQEVMKLSNMSPNAHCQRTDGKSNTVRTPPVGGDINPEGDFADAHQESG